MARPKAGALKSSDGFVLDNSIVMAWSFEDEVNDAAYLELAIRRGLPLATIDGKLRTAAEAVGVALLEV